MESASRWLTASVGGILLLGVVGSVLATLVTHLCVKHLFPRFRRYAERMPRSLARAVYYRLLVASIRGKTHQTQMFMLSTILVFGGGFFAWSANTMVQRSEQLSLRAQTLRSQLSSSQPTTEPSVASKLQEILELDPHVQAALKHAQYMRLAAFAAFLVIIIWAEYSVVVRAVAFEFERLMVRLPGVVTKDEFRGLCRLEMAVTNPRNLEPFLLALHRLTQHYELSTIFVPYEVANIHESEGTVDPNR